MTLLITPPRLLPSCTPKFATRRRPERESFGGEIAGGGAGLGQPFMAHQREIARTGGGCDPGARRPAHLPVRVTVIPHLVGDPVRPERRHRPASAAPARQ